MCIEIVNYFRQCNKFLQPTHFLSIAFGNRERYFDHRLIQFAVVVAEFAIINDAVSHGSVSLRVVVFKVLELLQKSLPLRFRKFGWRISPVNLFSPWKHRIVYFRAGDRERFRGKRFFSSSDNRTTPHIPKTPIQHRTNSGIKFRCHLLNVNKAVCSERYTMWRLRRAWIRS